MSAPNMIPAATILLVRDAPALEVLGRKDEAREAYESCSESAPTDLDCQRGARRVGAAEATSSP